MKFPSIKDVFMELVETKKFLKGICESTDIRLQVYESGRWAIRTGSSDYDQDHSGFWGASSIEQKTNSMVLAIDLLDQVEESYAMAQPIEGA
jgi:hypothetical protein